MILTKNLQNDDALARMTAAAFPGRHMRSARELTEGLCNAAYRITLDDGTETIVKIAPARADTLLSNEVGMMAAEVRAMRRFDELRDKGQAVTYDSVLEDVKRRDEQDTTRKESPLTIAPDATEVSTDDLNADEVVQVIMALMGRF